MCVCNFSCFFSSSSFLLCSISCRSQFCLRFFFSTYVFPFNSQYRISSVSFKQPFSYSHSYFSNVFLYFFPSSCFLSDTLFSRHLILFNFVYLFFSSYSFFFSFCTSFPRDAVFFFIYIIGETFRTNLSVLSMFIFVAVDLFPVTLILITLLYNEHSAPTSTSAFQFIQHPSSIHYNQLYVFLRYIILRTLSQLFFHRLRKNRRCKKFFSACY